MLGNSNLIVSRANPPVNNNPPIWDSQPAPIFIDGTASNYELDDLTSDPDEDTVTISLNTGTASLPSGVTWNDSLDRLEYDGIGAINTTTGHIAIASDTKDTTDSNSFSIIIQTAVEWPENAWFLTGGYQISDNGVQLVDEPWLTYNAEKDMLIPQMFAPDKVASMDQFTGFFKGVKAYNPNIKVIVYSSPSVSRKPEFYANGNSLTDYAYRIIEDAGDPDWYLRDLSGNKLQAKYSFQYNRNSWCSQFQTVNGSGRVYGEEYFQQWYDAANTVGANGKQLDYMDGIYMDVVPPSPQESYVYASSPRVKQEPDYNQNGVTDDDEDETIPVSPITDDGYGGVRMERLGMVQWVDHFKAIFGSNMAMFRNGTRDGLNYNAPLGGGLKDSTHPMTDSEFYQAWDGGNNEIIMGSLGIRKNGTTKNYDFENQGFHIFCRYVARQKACHIVEGSHQWGKYGAHILLCQMQLQDPAGVPGGVWREVDYNVGRFVTMLCRINGVATALNVNNRLSFPLMDEDCFPCGDTVDGNPPTTGTYSPSVAVNADNLDYVLNSPDYTSGGADFYWQEFFTADGNNKYLCLLRSDWTGGNEYGYGSTAACELPNPDSAKVWVHIDTTSTVTTGIRSTRGQDNTLNDGGPVDSGGLYGTVSLLRGHSVMLVTEDI